jgi:membrane associated rhomboid family serine protease
MREVPLGDTTEKFYLDVCRKCEFVWFDPSEFESVPRAPVVPVKEERPLPQAAREALAMYRVQKIAEESRSNATDSPDEWWKVLPALLRLPVEYDNPVSRFPGATLALIALVVFASFAAFGNLEDAASQFGFVPGEWLRAGGLTIITAFFLHANFLHLLGNMYFLFVFGDNVEDVLGKRRFLLLIFAATVAGNVLHALFAPNSTTPCIGASGGISAIIVFYALQFPHARLGWLVYFRWVNIPAYAALILWICYQLLLVVFQTRGLTNVSALAHIGGASIGFLYWMLFNKSRGAEPALPSGTRIGSGAPPLRGS